MIRTTFVPDNVNCHTELELPEDCLGEEVEIIAFKKQEGFSDAKKSPKKFHSFRSIAINTAGFRFNREDANER